MLYWIWVFTKSLTQRANWTPPPPSPSLPSFPPPFVSICHTCSTLFPLTVHFFFSLLFFPSLSSPTLPQMAERAFSCCFPPSALPFRPVLSLSCFHLPWLAVFYLAFYISAFPLISPFVPPWSVSLPPSHTLALPLFLCLLSPLSAFCVCMCVFPWLTERDVSPLLSCVLAL